jgi:hypothetical protein
MRVVIRREMLGAREQAWSLWSGKDIIELTSRQIKDLISKGEKVYGLKVQNSELVPDNDIFFTSNVMEHRISNNFKPMIESDVMVNQFYICVGSRMSGKDKVYDCISTRFEQVTLTEADMKSYLKLGVVSGGARLEGDKIVTVLNEEPEPKAKPEPIKAKPEPKSKGVQGDDVIK